MKIKLSAVALLAAGVMFILYPALRPWTDESTLDGALAAMGSNAWVASHAFAMLGFILVALGVLALNRAGAASPTAIVTAWIGAGLVLPYYGAEDFGLHEIAVAYQPGDDLLGTVEAVRNNPVAMTMFGAGLVLLAVAGLLTAFGVWRTGSLSRWSGVPFAIGYALFLPQFFAPAPVRIAHGIVLGLGLAWLGVALIRARPKG